MFSPLLSLSHIQLHIYDRYVRDLGDLLRNCIKCYERDELETKAFYEKRVSDLERDLARYQQTTGESGAADLVTSSQQNQPTRILEMMKWVLENEKFRRDLLTENDNLKFQ